MANDVTAVLEQLIERCASGDASALELLYKNTAAQLFGVLRRILVRQDLAQEALQDVYVSIWRNAKDYRAAKAAAFTWMVSIARYRAIDIKRSRRREVQFADPARLRSRGRRRRRLRSRERRRARRRRAALARLPEGAQSAAAQRGVSCVLERAHARRGRGHARLAARHRQELGAARPGKPQEVYPAMRYDDPNLLDSLAREYVIGTLHGRARRRFGARAVVVARRAPRGRELGAAAHAARGVRAAGAAAGRELGEDRSGDRRAQGESAGGVRRRLGRARGGARARSGLVRLAVLHAAAGGRAADLRRGRDRRSDRARVAHASVRGRARRCASRRSTRGPCPPGSSYELWMLPNGGCAARFARPDSGRRQRAARLERRSARGARQYADARGERRARRRLADRPADRPGDLHRAAAARRNASARVRVVGVVDHVVDVAVDARRRLDELVGRELRDARAQLPRLGQHLRVVHRRRPLERVAGSLQTSRRRADRSCGTRRRR